ncbi:hypothetical protein Dimus_029062 [Dionaea muscipula]
MDIELDGLSLASILGIPDNYDLCDYVKEVWEETKYLNLPRLMIKHIAYVISVPHQELPYGELLTRVFDAFKVPLDDKEGDEPVRTDFYEKTFLNMCQIRREDGIWWIGTGANRRRDDIENEAVENEEE